MEQITRLHDFFRSVPGQATMLYEITRIASRGTAYQRVERNIRVGLWPVYS
jgi:hypothetical protein